MIINRNNVLEVIEKSGLSPDKDYGQNYLVDENIAKNIVSLLTINETNKVLEIGPGLGSLTHYINEVCNNYTLVDIDKRMTDFLHVVYPYTEIINNDIRKVDVSSYDKIIGNLPYNITTDLVIYLLINAKKIHKMILMCQAEAFSRFNDLSGEAYGPASVLVHLLGTIKKEIVVKPGSFIPAPKCNSVVFTFRRNHDSSYEEAVEAYFLAKQLFISRRKTILNNLSIHLGNKALSMEVLNKANIPYSKRPEELMPEVYIQLNKMIKTLKE